jgi:hypothetical protein
VRRHLQWHCWLALAAAWTLSGCGGSGGGNNPSGTTTAQVSATVAGFFDALRRADPAGLRAVLAPDYNYDGRNAEQLANAFDGLLSLTYGSLDYRIETLTVRDRSATASVVTAFQGNINMEPLGYGRPTVNGSSRLELELQPRGDAWKLTAQRLIRIQFVHPPTVPARLYDYTVNGQTSLQVAPGTPLKLAGKSDLSFFIIAFLGGASAGPVPLQTELAEPWELAIHAPGVPGRFLAYALSFAFDPDPRTSEIRYLHGDEVAIPVTVVAP